MQGRIQENRRRHGEETILDGKTLAQRIREFTTKLDVVKRLHEYCDMRMAEIIPACDTPGCHAGWAAMVLGDEPVNKIVNYAYGKKLLANFLGFGSIQDLLSWAMQNP